MFTDKKNELKYSSWFGWKMGSRIRDTPRHIFEAFLEIIPSQTEVYIFSWIWKKRNYVNKSDLR